MSWNSYGKHVREFLLKRLHSNTSTLKEETVDQRKKITLNLSYLDVRRDHLSRSLIRKLTSCFNESVKFMKQYKANKLKMFCSSKVEFIFNKKLMLFKCWGCFNKYIGKTDRNIITRIDEHEKNTAYKLYRIWRIYQILYASWYTIKTIVSKDLHLRNGIIRRTKIIYHNGPNYSC